MNNISKLIKDFFHEINYYTLRLGWKCIVDQRTEYGQCMRKVWEYTKTKEVREERFTP